MDRSLALAGAALAWAALALAQAPAEETTREVIERTNALRQSLALGPVQPEARLAEAATAFARYMARTGNYGHQADGRRPEERAAAHGYERCIVTENIAYTYRSTGYASAAELAGVLMRGWENSPPHRKNLLDPDVTQLGVGAAQAADGRIYAVQLFGRPRSAAWSFSVENRSGRVVTYVSDGKRVALAPREKGTHAVCRPVDLEIAIPGKAEPYRTRVAGAMRYTVMPERVTVRGTGPE